MNIPQDIPPENILYLFEFDFDQEDIVGMPKDFDPLVNYYIDKKISKAHGFLEEGSLEELEQGNYF
jgi:hypothetical protein